MNSLRQIAQLLSTDLTFRQAFLDNPEKAIAARGLSLDGEAKAALASAQGLLAIPPRELAERVSRFTNIYGSWGGFTLVDTAPVPQLP